MEARLAPPRSLPRAAYEPLVPVAILALAAAACAAAQAWLLVWVCFAAVAGYSVSGSP